MHPGYVHISWAAETKCLSYHTVLPLPFSSHFIRYMDLVVKYLASVCPHESIPASEGGNDSYFIKNTQKLGGEGRGKAGGGKEGGHHAGGPIWS